MALKKTDISKVPAPAIEKSVPEPAVPLEDTIILQLALYKNYNLGGTIFTEGTPYRFKKEDAIRLLGEQDAGRPVWKQYREKKKVEVKHEIVDSTHQEIQEVGEYIHGVDATAPKRIDIGSDEEISDILNRGDNVDV